MQPELNLGPSPFLSEDFGRLGTIVAYRARRGGPVVHQLWRRKGRKWIAKGINNRDFDPEPATAKNLIGVIYAVFNAEDLEK